MRQEFWAGRDGAQHLDFYTRRMYYRVHDCWNRPICSAPDAWIDIMERTSVSGQKPLELTGRALTCLNLGSYNYLGFAAQDPYCTPRVEEALDKLGWGACSSRADAGTTPAHQELEELVARFVGKEAAITCGMGFATNSAFLPLLGGKGTLFVSDALNHASIVAGVRGSGAKVKVFDHNDPNHLEAVVVVVEGIYSMEGEMVSLKRIVEVKKKYKAYLYLDEAHSIGALGAGGRGVCEQAGVDPADVDIMMGTFTKSFGSCGGYIAGDARLIAHLRAHCPAHLYATAMSPPAAEQVVSALRVVAGLDGTGRGAAKIAALHDNSNYVRARLLQMGLNVLGDWDSPVMPVMVFNPAKLASASRTFLARGVAVVVVGFPATPLLTARMRICVSAAHSRADLDFALETFEDVAEADLLRYARGTALGARARAAADARLGADGGGKAQGRGRGENGAEGASGVARGKERERVEQERQQQSPQKRDRQQRAAAPAATPGRTRRAAASAANGKA
eukprot:scaffold2.g7416.t1